MTTPTMDALDIIRKHADEANIDFLREMLQVVLHDDVLDILEAAAWPVRTIQETRYLLFRFATCVSFPRIGRCVPWGGTGGSTCVRRAKNCA